MEVNKFSINLQFFSGLKKSTVQSFSMHSHTHKVKHDRLAFDLKCDRMGDLFRLLQENHKEYYLVRMENPEVTKTWAHIEIGLYEIPEELKIFNP